MEKRTVLALILCFGIWFLWLKLYGPEPETDEPKDEPAKSTAQESVGNTAGHAGTPEDENGGTAETAEPKAVEKFETFDDIVLETENLRVAFTTEGAAIREAWLKKYEIKAGVEPDRLENWYRILREDMTQDEERLVRRTGALRLLGGEDERRVALDTASWDKVEHDVEAGKVVFAYPLPGDLKITKTWTIVPGPEAYHLELRVDVLNPAGSALSADEKRRLQICGPVGLVSDVGDGSRVVEKPVSGYAGLGRYESDEVMARNGYSRAGTEDEPLEDAWVGLGNLFFLSALLPDASTPASEIRIWQTYALDAVEALERELLAVEAAAGGKGPRTRREKAGKTILQTSELAGFTVVTAPSCGGCGGSQRTPEIIGIQEELNRAFTPAELKALAGESLATALRFDFEVPAAGTALPVFKGKLFLGPKAKAILAQTPYVSLEQTRDLGWFSWLGEFLLTILGWLYAMVGNYGVAIILLTLVVRGAMFPLSRHQQVSMQRYSKDMARVKPKLDALKEKYGDNPKKMNAEMMKMYKAEGVSMVPKGCLVMFLQIPIFIGLFGALRAAIELRHAPFLWVADLTGPDHLFHMPWFKNVPLLPEWFNLFPITMTVLWWLSAKMAPKPADPQQQQTAKMMQYMPIIFGVMLYKYQAGLAIYMTVSSLWSIVETRMVRRALAKQDGDEGEGLRPVIRKG